MSDALNIAEILKDLVAAIREQTEAIKTTAQPRQSNASQGFAQTGTAHTGWRAFEVPFGKQAGKQLGSLPRKSLEWWIGNYKANGYQGRPPRQSDLDFRKALDEGASELKIIAPANDGPAVVESMTSTPASSNSVTDEEVPF